MVKTLMTARRFAPLFWCQFFSALNDNFVKNALVILILFKIGSENSAVLVTLAGAVFIAPFFFLASLAGELTDRNDKSLVARKLKLFEIPVALLAGLGFILHSVPILFVALGLFGAISALFGPVKYGILPDHLKTSELAAGNALVEGATFLAILLGTIFGGWAASGDNGAILLAALAVGLAVLCWMSAQMIPPTVVAAPGLPITRNVIAGAFNLLSELRQDKRIWIGSLIVNWFWLVGAVALALLPTMIKDRFGGTEGVVTLALAAFTIGIAIGSALAARVSRVRPNMAVVPLGGLIISLFAADIAYLVATAPAAAGKTGPAEFLQSAAGLHLLVDLVGIAIGGGLFVVPSFAAVQAWAEKDRRARVIAGGSVLFAIFVAGSGLVLAGLQAAGVGLGWLWGGLALANLAVTLAVLRAWGRAGVRDVAAFLFRQAYGLEVKGMEHLETAGPRAVIAPNHVSLLDGPFLHAVLPNDAAFAIDTAMSQRSVVKPFLKAAEWVSIDPTRPLSARKLVNTVKSGKPLVIFPEGRITVTGGLMKVYDGAAMIADKADAMVVPVRIDGAERTRFGYLSKSEVKKALFPKVTVTFLPPVRLPVDPALKGKARRLASSLALHDIMVDTAVRTANVEQTLFEALVEARRTRDTGKPAVMDPLGVSLSYKRLIAGAQVLGAKLAPMTSVGEAVGVMLPNTSGVAVTFFALQAHGRVPAMLNFSAGPANVVSACRSARVKTVVTSEAFIEKAHLEKVVAALKDAGVAIHYLEATRAAVTKMDKIRGLLAGGRAPVARRPDDPAVILFTSGSEGTPKGVVLSHKNILSNVWQGLARIAANGDDKVFNVLPVFHSFGLTAGLIMPLIGGFPVFLYPSPLHYRIVPELVYASNATILFGTDTFLNGYARAAHPYDFRSLRLILAGAEAVKERTRQIYMDRFGVRILEGYGVTETAPILAVNTPLSNKPGTVGRLSPLMEHRLEPVPGITEGGRLFVRGPNVMLGYFRAEKPGVLEPPADGWYDTGDIVTLDAQGYITIKGRAKRFAKIAGEMVSLSAVEALASEAWPTANSAVVSIPDARKGERLILITTAEGATRDAFGRHAKAKGATELMVPAEVIVQKSLPVLGSGKADYVTLTAEAKARAAGAPGKSESGAIVAA